MNAAHFFESIARRYDRAYGLDARQSRARMAHVIVALDAPPGPILDLGVGTGRELSALQDAGFEVTGLDASETMLALCNRRTRPVPLVLGDLWSPLPFGDGSFRGALALYGTLSHPPDNDAPRRLAREIARVLTPGAPFVFEVPSLAWLASVGAGASDDARGTRIVVTGDGHCVHEDTVTGASIVATIRSEEAWRALFAPWCTVTFEPLGPHEMRGVARVALRP